ncbi:Aldo/keto reductase [Schizophyllum commune H4-8]|uniref:NADP-dependent oxidoreductase domain-containing protein n=1 Tax=Schizophyllum commune (strain H4-8 / FGSC 9210) TaxID=578458 RepID=D8PVH5_SCHCM|nr:Aldo/keto reductase [Schizophyllum commune H4-8]KAI5900351.1 Aldo/keto reductase [Schizophyllum commune H4-8]
MSQPRVPLVCGIPVGAPGSGVRITDLATGQKFVDIAVGHGVMDFDVANGYSKGTAEEVAQFLHHRFVGKLDLKGALIDTKASVKAPGAHSAENLRKAALQSVAKLAPHKINVYYLHTPDRSVPYEETCEAINQLYKDGIIQEFGLSNYHSWEVAEIYYICKANGWLLPTVYQGRYNAIQREVEAELFPCLRKFGIRFYAYSPLAGGLLSGNFLTEEDFDKRPGSRFDPKTAGHAHFLRGLAAPVLPVIRELAENLSKYDTPLPEAATRWLQHHSMLDPEKGDRVIIGASLLEQLETNLKTNTLGPLPVEVLQVVDDAGSKAVGRNIHYAF